MDSGRGHAATALPPSAEPLLLRTLVRSLVVAIPLVYWTANPDLSRLSEKLIFASWVSALVIVSAVSVWRGAVAGRGALIVALLLVAATLIPAAFSPHSRLSLEASVAEMGSVAVLMFAALGVVSRWEVLCSLALTSLVGGLMALGSLASWWADAWTLLGIVDERGRSIGELWSILPRATIGGSDPNTSATVLAVGAIAGVGMALMRSGWLRRLGATAALVSSSALLGTGSRGGLLALLVGFAVLGARTRRPRPTSRRLIAIALALVVSSFLIALSGLTSSSFVRGGLDTRLPAVEAGVEMFVDRPLVGAGTGAFVRSVDEYMNESAGSQRRPTWAHSHNALIELLLERGLFGFAAFAAVFVLVGRSIRRNVEGADTVRVLLAVVTVILAHGLVEAVLAGVARPAIVALVVGSMLQRPDGPRAVPARRAPTGAIAVMGMAAPIIVGLGFPASLAYENGLEAARGGDWNAARVRFDDARTADPLPVYASSYRVAAARSGLDVAWPSDSTPFVVVGVDLMNEVLEYPSLLRARVLLEAGWADEVALLEAGDVLETLGDRDGANLAYRKALDLNAWLVSSPFWDAGPPRSAYLDAYVKETIDRDPCSAPEPLVLYGELAGETLERIAGGCRGGSALLAALARLGDFEAISVRTKDVGSRRVLFRYVGLSEQHDGDVEGARRRFLLSALAGDPLGMVLLLDTYESEPPALSALADSLVSARTPVWEYDNTPVYRLATWRTTVTQLRPSLPNPVLPGSWELARTRTSVQLYEMTHLAS